MSDKSLKSILVITITALYYIFFFFNCIIIPYPAGYDNYIICNGEKNVFDSEKHEKRPFAPLETNEQNEQLPADVDHRDDSAVEPGSAAQDMQKPPDSTKQPARELSDSPAKSIRCPPDATGQDFGIPWDSPGQPVQDHGDCSVVSPDSAGGTTLSPRDTAGQYGETEPESARQSGTRVLLSGNRTVKALSELSLKDKLWLIAILSRCSMEELLSITALLEDGVTYQENLEMYRILHQRVTDSEQKRLDTLIKAYTQNSS